MKKMFNTLWVWLLFISLCSVSPMKARGVKEFAHPAYMGATTSLFSITKVEFTDTATILSFHLRHRPGYWILMARDYWLCGEDNRKYKALRGEGITLGEQFVTPSSGEADFRMFFEPMPRKTRFFDFIEGNAKGAFRIYGVHEEGKAPRLPRKRDTFVMTPELEREFFKEDTICVKGRIEGYSRSQGYSTMQFPRRNKMTGEAIPLTVDIREDGTFELRYPASYPENGSLVVQTTNEYKSFPFYAVPGQTSELVLKADGSVAYTLAPSGPFGRRHSLEQDFSDLGGYPYLEFQADADSLGFKSFIDRVMQKMQKRLSAVDYISWRYGYTPWERHLAECHTRLEHGTAVFEYVLQKRFDLIGPKMTQEDLDEYMKMRDRKDYLFVREMPCNDVTCLVLKGFDVFMNRYKYSAVVSSGLGTVQYMEIDSVVKSDSIMMAGEKEVLGTDAPSFCGRLVILYELASDLKDSYVSYPSLCDSIYDSRLAYMDREVLRTQAGRLLEKARQRSSLTYELPDTPAADLLRRFTEKYEGKYLMIDFWGMSCGPCRSGIQRSKKMRETLRNHPDVDFLFISAEGDGPEEDYRKYVAEWLDGEDVVRVSRDEFNSLMELFGFLGIPHYETLDRQGNVVRNALHYDWDEHFLKQLDELKSKLDN